MPSGLRPTGCHPSPKARSSPSTLPREGAFSHSLRKSSFLNCHSKNSHKIPRRTLCERKRTASDSRLFASIRGSSITNHHSTQGASATQFRRRHCLLSSILPELRSACSGLHQRVARNRQATWNAKKQVHSPISFATIDSIDSAQIVYPASLKCSKSGMISLDREPSSPRNFGPMSK